MANEWVAIGLPILTGIAAWIANEWRKRASDERLRREERYRSLLQNSKAFYVATQDEAAKAKFIEEVNLSWLYCPDAVIRAMYTFLDALRTGAPGGPAEAELALSTLVLAMRRDIWGVGLLRRTRLSATEYRHVAPSEATRAVSLRNPPNTRSS